MQAVLLGVTSSSHRLCSHSSSQPLLAEATGGEQARRKPLPGLGECTETTFSSQGAHRILASLPTTLFVREKYLLGPRPVPRSTPTSGTCSRPGGRSREMGRKEDKSEEGKGPGSGRTPPLQLRPKQGSLPVLSSEDGEAEAVPLSGGWIQAGRKQKRRQA